MPNTKSAHKALRQNVKRREHNRGITRAFKDAAKWYKKEPTGEGLSTVYKKLDKAAKTNAISQNKASRLKSRLAKRLTAKAK